MYLRPRILVPPTGLPGFWKFMYRVSPLTYILEGLAIAGISGTTVACSAVEMLEVILPPDMGTCEEYMAAYIQSAGGYIANGSESSGYCLYCPVSDANMVLQSLGMGTEKMRAWRNLGLMAVYVVFDVLAVFLIYWLARVPRKGIRSRGSN
jgi:ABC-type multidrug transport system permease subunit